MTPGSPKNQSILLRIAPPTPHQHYFHGGRIADQNPHSSEAGEFVEYMSLSAHWRDHLGRTKYFTVPESLNLFTISGVFKWKT